MPVAIVKHSGPISKRKENNNPAALDAKVRIREMVLAAVGGGAWVFDAFAGRGVMYDRVWHEAAGYVGCDLEYHPDIREAFVADNRRVMRAIDLQPFRIFDFDAYGSPWEQCIILAARRIVAADETIGIVLTEGSPLDLKMGHIPTALRLMARLNPGVAGTSLPNITREIISRAVDELARRMRCEVTRRWQAEGKTGAQVRYLGLVLKGLNS